MNSVFFSFSKYQKYFIPFWLLASARKIMVLPESGGAPARLARTPMEMRTNAGVDSVEWTNGRSCTCCASRWLREWLSAVAAAAGCSTAAVFRQSIAILQHSARPSCSRLDALCLVQRRFCSLPLPTVGPRWPPHTVQVVFRLDTRSV